jgi:hypothetical protein
MIVLRSLLNEYSTAMGFDLVTRLTTKPVDSRSRRVLVSICLRHLSDVTAQLPMLMRRLLKRKQDLGRPSADKDRDRPVRPGAVVLFLVGRWSRYNLVFAAHKTTLRLDIEMVRVTNVAGFGWTR